MSVKWRVWLSGVLLAAVIAAALYFPALRRQVNKAKDLTEKTAEQARRELLPVAPVTSGEPMVKVMMYWGSRTEQGALTPVTVELPLSNDPVLRAKQVLNTLLAFYILPDGTGVADFSEELRTSIPSGIQSEQLAVESIVRTLEANVPQVLRLKILIHGQEVETLAGHLDLTQAFRVSAKDASGVKLDYPSPPKSILPAPIEKAVEKVRRATRR